jgi:rSAM/selenodomain-associated transferase 2
VSEPTGSPFHPSGDAPLPGASRDSKAFVSLIVPIRNEPPEAAARFAAFARRNDSEVLVADGGGSSDAAAAFRGFGARIVPGEGSRGRCLEAAAREARGEILLFFHADTVPPGNALDAARESLDGGAVAGAFTLAFSDASPALRWVAWWANRRARIFGLPFGDQGLFCRAADYRRAGGFRDLPICDDLDLVRRLRRLGRIAVRREKAVTSSRRYRENGTIGQVLRDWRVQAGWFAGVAPERLARWYEPSGRGRPRGRLSSLRRPE